MRLFKRGRIWWAAIYSNGVRVRASTRCRDKTAAESVARRWEREAADPDHAATHKATLADAIERLIKVRTEEAFAGKRSHSTVAFYKAKAGHLARVLGEDLRLRALTAPVVDAYISKRREEGAVEHTIHKELVALRACLKLAKRANTWSGDVAAILPVGFSPAYEPKTRTLKAADVPLLLAQLSSDHAARVAFIVATGARWGEAEAALVEDATPDPSVVLLRGTKTARSWREVPIVGQWQRDLLEHALRHAAGPGAKLFGSWEQVRWELWKACERARLERVSPNDLRRTFGTLWREMGAPPDLIAAMMGHRDSRMVERVYGRLPTESLRARLERVVCDTVVPDPRQLPGQSGQRAGSDDANPLKTVPRDGIEPPARGFSVSGGALPTPRKVKGKVPRGGAVVTELWRRSGRKVAG